MPAIKWPKISQQPNGIPPAPILVVCVGTAGYTRGRNFCQHMLDSERIHRIQSVIVCDYNTGTMSDVWRSKVPFRTRGKASPIAMITPEQQNTDDGFTLNPLLFQDSYGAINRDLDNIVSEAQMESSRKGRDPQVILEFMGFGGHSIIGVLLHRKLRDAYPAAKMFPVIGIPNDLVLKQWMVYEFEPPTGNAVLPPFTRNGVYRAYVEGLELRPTEAALFVDNIVDASPNNRLSAGLATIEAAGTDQIKGGSIPEALGGVVMGPSEVFPGDNIQKLNMNVARVQLEQDGRKKVRWSREQEPTYAIKKACWSVVTGNSLLSGEYTPAPSTNIYLSLPVKDDRLHSLREAVLEELQVEGFFQRRDANILIGSSLYESVPRGRYEVTAAALESLSKPPQSMAKTFADYQPPKTPGETHEYSPSDPPSNNGVTESQPQDVAV